MYKELIDRLYQIQQKRHQNSEFNHRMCANEAIAIVRNSLLLNEELREQTVDKILTGNPTGYHWENSGIYSAIEFLETFKHATNDARFEQKAAV